MFIGSSFLILLFFIVSHDFFELFALFSNYDPDASATAWQDAEWSNQDVFDYKVYP